MNLYGDMMATKNKVNNYAQKKTVRGFIKYSSSGYFGDSDIFGSYISTEASQNRDSTAITTCESVIFYMPS